MHKPSHIALRSVSSDSGSASTLLAVSGYFQVFLKVLLYMLCLEVMKNWLFSTVKARRSGWRELGVLFISHQKATLETI